MHRSRVVGMVLAGVLAVAGCSSTPTSSASPGTSAAPGAVDPGAGVPGTAGAEPTTDEMTPLLVSALSEPIPVLGTDGRYHVAYELQVLNYSPREATLTSIETVDASTDEVVASIDTEEIVARSILVGSALAAPRPATTAPPGATLLVLLDDTYAAREDVPAEVVHRIRATFAPPAADQAPYAGEIYPATITQTTAPVRLGSGEPLRIGSPLQGDGWMAVNACCTLTPHRGAMLPLDGRINATERYAIDWLQIEPERLDEALSQGLLPSFASDPTRNEDYLAHDEPLLAVGDGTVVAVVDGFEDSVPQELPSGLGIDGLGGNTLVLDLGDGYFAFYAHVAPGSFTVAEGDRVTRGQVLARLGNTGNSTEAHLHFHVMRGRAPLASTNWPFVIDDLDVVGSVVERDGVTSLVAGPTPGPRRDELVLAGTVTSFPVVTDERSG